MVRVEAVERRIVLDCQFDDAPLVWADRVQLQQLVLNLVMNALDAVADVFAGEPARHRAHAAEHERSAVVSVENEGSRVTADQSQPDAGAVLHDEARRARTRAGNLP